MECLSWIVRCLIKRGFVVWGWMDGWLEIAGVEMGRDWGIVRVELMLLLWETEFVTVADLLMGL